MPTKSFNLFDVLTTNLTTYIDNVEITRVYPRGEKSCETFDVYFLDQDYKKDHKLSFANKLVELTGDGCELKITDLSGVEHSATFSEIRSVAMKDAVDFVENIIKFNEDHVRKIINDTKPLF